jgi:hypothetical protein
MKQLFAITLVALLASPAWAGEREERHMITIADGNRGEKGGVDTGQPGPSQGDMFVFEQPLMDKDHNDIGSNNGYCITTRVGVHSQCQWTLTLVDGAIVVAGEEAERGSSVVAVIGTTGAYAGFTGELTTTPNGDGTFIQELRLHR